MRPVPTGSRLVPGTGKPDQFPVPPYREPELGTGRGYNSKETLGNWSGNRSSAATTPGYRHWVRLLRPLAERGFRHGVLTDSEVILICDVTEAELRLPRLGVNGWTRADLAVPVAEPPDPNDPEVRGITYLMKRTGTDRMELTA